MNPQDPNHFPGQAQYPQAQYPQAQYPQAQYPQAGDAPLDLLAVAGPVPAAAWVTAGAVAVAGVALWTLLAVVAGRPPGFPVILAILGAVYAGSAVRTSRMQAPVAAALGAQVATGRLAVTVSTPRSVFSPVWRQNPSVLRVDGAMLSIDGVLGPVPLAQVQLVRPSAFTNIVKLGGAAQDKVLVTAFHRFDLGVYMASRVNRALVDALAQLQGHSGAAAQPAQVWNSPSVGQGHGTPPGVQAPDVATGAPAAAVAAGWYQDPWGQAALRYHDGQAWTPHVS